MYIPTRSCDLCTGETPRSCGFPSTFLATDVEGGRHERRPEELAGHERTGTPPPLPSGPQG